MSSIIESRTGNVKHMNESQMSHVTRMNESCRARTCSFERVYVHMCMNVGVCACIFIVYVCVCVSTAVFSVWHDSSTHSYGVASMSGLLKIISLFYKISSLL